MNAAAPHDPHRRVSADAPGPAAALQRQVLDPVLQHIVAALAARLRYRYVQPLVLPQDAAVGTGWKIVSPNCSRQISPDGGLIPIAWLQPDAGRWQLHAHNHRRQQWVLVASNLTLDDAMDLVCQDPLGSFWP